MWIYQKQIKEFKDPSGDTIISEMNDFGQEGWEIFSISERIIEQWMTYGYPHKIVEYTLYMKKQI